MFETIIVGNVDTCRTEAQIADETGNRVAVVYEDSNGWHTEILDDRIEQTSPSFNALLENAKEVLSHYVNRRGDFAERLGYELPFVFVDHVAWSVCSDFLHVDTVAFEDVDHLPDAGNVLGRASLEPADAEAKLVTSE